MNLQDQQLRQASEEIMRQCDFEVLADVMTRFGWHKVDLDRYTDNYHAIDVREWVQDNCQGKYHSYGRHWIFEQSSDAVLFKLRWG
jgi:hypothetical protein